MKTCSKCKETKSKDEFSKQRCKADGLRYHCKTCRSNHQKMYFKANKVKMLAKNKVYYEANKDTIQAKNKVYWNNKYHIDVNFRLAKCLRSRLYNAIKDNQKTGSAVSDLGCSVEYLKKHLETQFQEGMSWDNWSKTGWHIDHIDAISNFDLSDREELLKACHYTNLQPMWAKENLSKGNR